MHATPDDRPLFPCLAIFVSGTSFLVSYSVESPTQVTPCFLEVGVPHLPGDSLQMYILLSEGFVVLSNGVCNEGRCLF